MSKIDDFAYLWACTDPDWVLLQVDEAKEEFLPYNLRTGTAVLIENDQLAAEVEQRMKSAGVRVVHGPEHFRSRRK